MAYPTNPIYKFIKDDMTGQTVGVMKQTGDSEPYELLCIPIAVGNTDYQKYLLWVAAGNTAEAAD